MIEISNLKEGSRFQGKLAVRSKETPRDYKNKDGKYFFMVLGNISGNIPVKYWGGSDQDQLMNLYTGIGVGDVVDFSGEVELDRFSGELSISVNEGVHILKKIPGSEIDPEDYLPKAEKDVDTMFSQLSDIISSIEDDNLSRLLASFMDDNQFVSGFKKSPSAMMRHHNYIGGLLEHTLAVATICDTLCKIHGTLKRNLLLTGAILHDIGKMDGYVYSTCINQSDLGKFLGHLILGDRMLQEKILKIPEFPTALKDELSHMITTHHAGAEVGIPSRIKTSEACALHYADTLDAYVKDFLQAVENGRQLGDKWVFDRLLGQEIFIAPEDQ